MALKCFVGIKGINLSSRFVLAPMAGVNCTSFRLLCRKCGAGMVFTQMYHCDFITSKLESEGKRAVFEHLNIISSEKPVAVQIIGSNPVNMAAAAELLQKKADMLDINLGCPDKDMVKAGCGAYYSIHPELIGDIVSPVLESAKIPVSAKIRIGWDSQSINGVSVAKELEKLGISALTVHGRTAVQKYSGKANWEIIRHIKSKLDIPVIGNGDINNSRRALEMLERTGCDYAMIGRRAMGDPGIFARCKNRQDGYDTKVSAEVPAKVPADVLAKVPADVIAKVPAEVPDPKQLFRRFAQYYKRYDHDKSFTEIRTHALWFAKRARLGPKARDKICRARDLSIILGIFDNFDN